LFEFRLGLFEFRLGLFEFRLGLLLGLELVFAFVGSWLFPITKYAELCD